ncbi:MAG: hypothetical protein LC725_10060 [Lentisphaerae bacterium]|nr:hypothetical protein [Lentisphaerota bacterium]
MTISAIFRKTDIPLEVVILLIAGMALLITGVLLFPVSSGALPYYANGLYGLLLVMFALQIVTIGKTPFGDVRRSKFVIAVGAIIAAAGIIICVVPDVFTRLSRILLFICFGPGGFLLFLQMLFAKGKFRTWVRQGAIFRHLIFACSMVYALSMMIALVLWNQQMLSTPLQAMVFLVYGGFIVYLACVLGVIYRQYPETGTRYKGGVEFSADQAMLLLMGIFMVLLGVLLIPVNLGKLAFSGSAQLGLLMVIFAIQMLASGNTPIGPYPRSRLMIVLGLLFAAVGIVSCIIPDILVPFLTFLVGLLNILGGFINLIKIFLPLLRRADTTRGPVHPMMQKLFVVQVSMSLLAIMFGTSMLVRHLVPGLVIGVILAANGCVLLYLLHLLVLLDKMQADTGGGTKVCTS